MTKIRMLIFRLLMLIQNVVVNSPRYYHNNSDEIKIATWKLSHTQIAWITRYWLILMYRFLYCLSDEKRWLFQINVIGKYIPQPTHTTMSLEQFGLLAPLTVFCALMYAFEMYCFAQPSSIVIGDWPSQSNKMTIIISQSWHK